MWCGVFNILQNQIGQSIKGQGLLDKMIDGVQVKRYIAKNMEAGAS